MARTLADGEVARDPKRSPYLDFCAANREQVVQELGPDAKPTEIMKELARRYNAAKALKQEEDSNNAPPVFKGESKKRKRSAVEADEIPTECATCQERTIAPIYKCPSGHLACWKCAFGYNPKLHKCPGCPLEDDGRSIGEVAAECRALGVSAQGSKAQMFSRLLQARGGENVGRGV